MVEGIVDILLTIVVILILAGLVVLVLFVLSVLRHDKEGRWRTKLSLQWLPLSDSQGRLSPTADQVYRVLSLCLTIAFLAVIITAGYSRHGYGLFWWLIPISAAYVLLLLHRDASLEGRAAWAWTIAALVFSPYLVALAYLWRLRAEAAQQSYQGEALPENGDNVTN